MTDFVANFQAMVSGLASSATQQADLLLLQLDAASAHRTRLCAIPHTFDATILRVLDPSLDEPAAAGAMDELHRLGAVIQLPGCLALHDVVRQQLFQQWLKPERRTEFADASRRLAQHFQQTKPATAVERTAHENSFVFHMIGADVDEGFKHFQLVYRERREYSSVNACEILVRLVLEYEAILPGVQRDWLSFCEAEIAGDTRDWPRAVTLLEGLLAKVIAPDLRSMTQLRLGSVLRQSGQYKRAASVCSEALKLLQEGGSVAHLTGAPVHLVHYELGLIARDQGDVERARSHFDSAILGARAARDPTDIAVTSNSLGTLLLRISPQDAVRIFTECLGLLSPERDGLRIAQVLNNLALAHSNAGEWEQSESYYQKSLDIKRIAGDQYGEAATLFNMARASHSLNKPAQAREALSKAATLFEDARDLKSAARAYRELARMTWDRATESTEATTYVRRALELYERAGDTTERKITRREFRSLLGERSRWWRWLLWTIVAIAVVVVVIALIAN